MKWLALAAQVFDKIPLERLLVRRPDEKARLRELAEILGEAHSKPVRIEPEQLPDLPAETTEETHPANLGNQRPKVHLEKRELGESDEQTVAYQNEEIGKVLLRMERHYAQKLRHNGIPCDCGSQKHLLDLESLCEETIAMVDNPDIYYQVINWKKDVAPKSTDQAAKSGKYDEEYPIFSRQARDFRKELISHLEPAALFPEKHMEEVTELPATQEITEEAFEKQCKDFLSRGIIT